MLADLDGVPQADTVNVGHAVMTVRVIVGEPDTTIVFVEHEETDRELLCVVLPVPDDRGVRVAPTVITVGVAKTLFETVCVIDVEVVELTDRVVLDDLDCVRVLELLLDIVGEKVGKLEGATVATVDRLMVVEEVVDTLCELVVLDERDFAGELLVVIQPLGEVVVLRDMLTVGDDVVEGALEGATVATVDRLMVVEEVVDTLCATLLLRVTVCDPQVEGLGVVVGVASLDAGIVGAGETLIVVLVDTEIVPLRVMVVVGDVEVDNVELRELLLVGHLVCV